MPLCFTPEGCPVEEWATDIKLNEQIDDYRRGKSLYSRTEDPRVMQMVNERLGLYDDPQTHIELEGIFAEWEIQQQRRKSQG